MLIDVMKQAVELEQPNILVDALPYARSLGVSAERYGDELLFRMEAKPTNIGNPTLPAIHGGVIAGFMELSAALYLMLDGGIDKAPKIIDINVDYLRPAFNQTCFAECKTTRQGKRVANVSIACWQKTREELVATARTHFLLQR